MKKFILTILSSLFFISVYAQMQITSDGSLKLNTYSTLHVTDEGTLAGANGFDFNSSSSYDGFLLEQNRSESSGFYCDGDFAVIYSPGDYGRLLRVYDEDGMVEKWYLDGSGNAYTISDEKDKENIKDIDKSLEKLLKLKSKEYNYKAKSEEKTNSPEENKYDPSQELYFGFLAQDVEKIYPTLVSKDEKGNMFVSYQQLIPIIIQGIKEQQILIDQQQIEIDELQAEVNQQQTVIDDLIARIKKLESAKK